MGKLTIPTDDPKIIHVNVNNIRHNAKHGDSLPIARVQYADSLHGVAYYGDEVVIRHKGEIVARLVYSPAKPLPCGAKVWIETSAEVEIANVRKHDEQFACAI